MYIIVFKSRREKCLLGFFIVVHIFPIIMQCAGTRSCSSAYAICASLTNTPAQDSNKYICTLQLCTKLLCKALNTILSTKGILSGTKKSFSRPTSRAAAFMVLRFKLTLAAERYFCTQFDSATGFRSVADLDRRSGKPGKKNLLHTRLCKQNLPHSDAGLNAEANYSAAKKCTGMHLAQLQCLPLPTVTC